jgi:hypothetical protein
MLVEEALKRDGVGGDVGSAHGLVMKRAYEPIREPDEDRAALACPEVSFKRAVGLAAVLVAAGAGIAAGAVAGGTDRASLPDYATVGVRPEPIAGAAGLSAAKAKKARVVYLQAERSPVDVDSTGPYVDIRIASCPGSSRVIGGGVVAASTDVYEQGSYFEAPDAYHVRLGFDDEATPADFEITSHLICLKGVK